MSDRPQTQPPRDQGTESSMSASGDGRRSTLRPRRPGHTGQPPSDATGSPKSKIDTQELLANTNPFRKLMPKIVPGGREQHALGSGNQENPADTLGDNDLVGQGLSDLSDVQRGKQKVPQGVGASTAIPNAGTPDSLVSAEAVSKKSAFLVGQNLDNLFELAVKAPRGNKHTEWPSAHNSFFEAYVDFYEDPRTKQVSWKAMRDDYGGFYGHHEPLHCKNKLETLRTKQKKQKREREQIRSS